MNTRDKCFHCGADYGLHKFETDNCPSGGIEETRDGRKQQWDETTFLALDMGRLQDAAPDLLNALELIAAENYDDDDKKSHLRSRIDSMKKYAMQAINKAKGIYDTPPA